MKLFNTKLWLPISLAAVALSAVTVTGTSVAMEFAPMVNDALGVQTSIMTGSGGAQYYKSDYDGFEEMFQAKVRLLREIAGEGTVLLKNDGVLPLASGKKLAVVGENAFKYATNSGGGSMHGSEVIATKTTLTEALAGVGLDIVTDVASADAVMVVLGRSWGEGSDLALGELALTAVERSTIDSAKASGKKVILVVSGDYSIEIGDHARDNGISAVLKAGNVGYRGAYGFADVIVGNVSPSGRLVDTYAVNSQSSPAIMNWGDYEYTNKNKIMASQASKYVSYNEGIYTDYRYYETRYEDCVLKQGFAATSAGVKASTGVWNYFEEVLYPFGYGLSYTAFEHEIDGAPVFDDKAHTATVKVKVKNVGDNDGKDVVQIYAQTPYTRYDKDNKVEKPSVSLMGFAKTDTLEKNGGTQTVEIKIDMQWLASYDYTTAKTYITDAGDYYFAVGNGAHDALNNILAAKGKTVADGMDYDGDPSLTYTWRQNDLDTTTYSKSVYTGNEVTNRFDDVDLNYWAKNKVTYLSRDNWQLTYPKTVSLEATADMLAFLNDTKKYENGRWNDTKARAYKTDVEYGDFETADEVNSAVKSGKIDVKNITVMRGKPYDDGGWKEILDTLSIYEMSRMIAQGRYYINACPTVTFDSCGGGDGPSGLTKSVAFMSVDGETGKTTAVTDGDTVADGITDKKIKVSGLDMGLYTSEPMLAATFNVELAERVGAMYGEDGLYTDTAFLWGLGADLHRTPYNGRMAEYYSADAVLSSLIGGAVARSSKAHGVVLVAKHFVINEQEQNRIGVATFTNEQALRENYLRAFEGIAVYGEMQGVMTAYNRIGMLSCTAEYDLITGVLREEWGSQAYVISDLNSPTSGLYDGNASIAAGLSTFLNNGTYDATSGAYVNCSLNVANIKSDPTLLYAAREACHRMLYNFVHSNAVNGISEDSRVLFVTPWWQPTLIVFSALFSIVAAGACVMTVLSEIKKEKTVKEMCDDQH